ncbi:hypothetical protein QA639_28800 [Bradyrhizobium pachyrhizi]|uniref:DUF6634 family protein n=1 Tax=Bradyrhizobium pachyrhizi TaxID=280333 RepID=UPI0024B0F922|nr:DUF6634 family protein [Bradyrhizobium pachyrhizi]WFU53640.1 hypothetical protein QA639_28800 [Bradyrhizobium pachyrhizi]
MSMEEKNAMAQRSQDFGCYLSGQEPSSVELERAPLLEDWCTSIAYRGFGNDPSDLFLVLMGSVVCHPELRNFSRIHTSQLIWLDRSRKWARTWNRVYRLGERSDAETTTE